MGILRTIYATICMILALAASANDSLRVSFVNIYPGEEIYELEGHSALRVRLDDYRDYAISYGTFDFNAPNFVYRFVKGETDYWVTECPWSLFEQAYKDTGRRIVEHPIPLDSLQAQQLLSLIAINLQPQNRTYRYNYVKDNCATRPLRLVEAAIGSQIELPQPTDGSQDDTTFRQVMRRYHRNFPWYQFGIDLALGSGIDYPITANEKAFSPVTLDTQLPNAMVNGHKLTTEPVIIEPGHDVVPGPTPWILSPMAFALAILILSVWFTIRDIHNRRTTRWFDAVLFAIFGLAGLLLTFLIFISVHEATSPNWLYLWLNPLCLIVPIFIWLKNCKIVVFSYQIVNFVLIFAMAVAWQWLGQSANAAFWPLIAADAIRSLSYIYLNYRDLTKNA